MSDVDETTEIDIRERGTFHRFQFEVQGNTEADCDMHADFKMQQALTDPDRWTVVSKSIIEEAVPTANGQTVNVLQAQYVVVRLTGVVPWLS